MLTSINLESYRSFQSYDLEGLSRVNLLVGKNNCGKTSMLEAVQLLASKGSPGVLRNIVGRRGELAESRPVTGASDVSSDSPTVTHLFHGHNFKPGSSFQISSTTDGLGVLVRAEPPPKEEQLSYFSREELRGYSSVLETRLISSRSTATSVRSMALVDDDGVLLGRTSSRHYLALWGGRSFWTTKCFG